jgi:hypothetical protein
MAVRVRGRLPEVLLIILILILLGSILILILLGSLPTWPYSGGWGYYPKRWRRPLARHRHRHRSAGGRTDLSVTAATAGWLLSLTRRSAA